VWWCCCTFRHPPTIAYKPVTSAVSLNLRMYCSADKPKAAELKAPSSGSSSGTGAPAGGDNPTAAALSQLLQGLSRLAQSLPKSSPTPG